MLNNFVLPASVSSGQAVEGVQPIQGFAPYNQLTELMPTFKLAEDGAKPEDEEKKKEELDKASEEHEQEDDGTITELFKMAFRVSFKEMLDYFLVPEHEKILDLQTKFRNTREAHDLTIFAPKGQLPAEFDVFRDKMYEIQMQLFKTPTGLHCHIII